MAMISDMSQNSIPRIADVAKQAGVVVATVSDVLNRPERVARATRLRVEAAIIELGYIPSSSARQLRGVRSKLIGMLATDLDDEFQLKVAQHVEAAASAAGRRILHCQTLGAVERELACLESFHEMGAEGVVLVSVGDVTAQLLRMEEAGIVSVVIDPKTATPFPSVGVVDEAGGHLAGNHLVDQGCRSIAFVSSGLGGAQVERRLAGAALAASSRGAI